MNWPWLLDCLYWCCYAYGLIYETVDKFVPSREDPDYAPKSAYGLVPLDQFSPETIGSGIDLIFVHGLGSNPDTTWLGRNRSCITDSPSQKDESDSPSPASCDVNWIPDLLYPDLPPLLQKNTRAFFYNYDSYWYRDSTGERRESLGKELFEHVSQMVEETPDRKIVFVGHSYGGLVIKEAILQARLFQNERDGNVFQSTKAVVFMGTPHRGSYSTDFGIAIAQSLSYLGFGANPDIIRAIRYDSKELQDMHRNFESQSRSLKIVNFFEKRKMPEFWGLFKGYVVEQQSATLDRPDATSWGLDTDHVGLNKFGGRDSNYFQVQKTLTRLMENIAKDSRIGNLVYSVPEKTTMLYTERAALTERLESHLQGRGGIVVITGLGGVGKTQLALRYAEKSRIRYDTILWVDARNNATIISGFQRCARAIGLTPRGSGIPLALRDEPAVDAVLHWLGKKDERYGDWLLIFDNADELDTGVVDMVPSKPYGTIIITTRNSQSMTVFPPGTRQLRVGDMASEEASSLLLSHLGLDTAELPEGMHKTSQSICKALHWYALAIHLAGAQIRANYPDEVEAGSEASEMRRLLDKFLVDFNLYKNELLKAETVKGLSSYDLTVWTVWDTSLAAIDRKYPTLASRPLLMFLAYMNAAKIPDDIFSLAAEGLSKTPPEQISKLPSWLLRFMRVGENGEWDKFGLESALKPLRQYSLVEYYRAGGYYGVSMHGLVQWKANLDGQGEGQPSWDKLHATFFSSAVRQALSDGAYDRGKEELWQFIGLHSPAPEAFITLGIEVSDPAYHMIGELYWDAHRHNQSRHLQLALMMSGKEKYGKNDLYVLVSYLNYINILGKDIEPMKDEFATAVAAWDFEGKRHYSLLARSMIYTISRYFLQRRRWQEAEEAVKDFIKRDTRVLGENVRPQSYNAKMALVLLYMRQGRAKEAQELSNQALKLVRRAPDPSPPHRKLGFGLRLSTTYAASRYEKAYRRGKAHRRGEAEELMETFFESLGQEFPDFDEAVLVEMYKLTGAFGVLVW